MIRAGSILVGVTAGLALAAPVRAESPAGPADGNPYAAVVTRNVFGLNPPPPPGPVTPVDPPPKITPNGIMNLFGIEQVLFKVEPPTGQPVKEAKSYTLSVGQREDDIEVLKIDDKASIVTFNNHGTVQDLPLVAAGSAPGGGPAGGPPSGPGPHFMNGGAPVPLPIGANRFNNPVFHPIMNRGIPANNSMNSGMNSGINNQENNFGGYNSGYNSGAVLGAGPAYMGNQATEQQSTAPNALTMQQEGTAGLTPQQIQTLIEVNRAKGGATSALLPPPP